MIASPPQRRSAVLASAIVFVVAAVYFALRPELVLGDPDLWWHIYIGQDIATTRSLPYTDSYSYTFYGAPWIAKEWLAQILFGAAHRLGGWSGVMLLSIFSVAACLAFLYRELSLHLNLLVAATVVVVAGASLTAVAIARPHILTLPILVILTARLFDASANQRTPPYWLLGLVVLWANLHGSFTLALVIAGFAFLDMLERNRLRDKDLILRWMIFGVLTALATLITPYGLTLYSINLAFIAGVETMSLITEWQPFSASRDGLMGICLLAAVGGLIAMRTNPGWARILLILFVLNMFLLHVRFVYVFFLVTPLLAAATAAATNPRVAAGDPDRATTSRSLAAAVVLASVLGFSVFAALQPFAPAKRRSIEDALAFIREKNLPATGPQVNGYNLGGVLIFNGFKTFLDGRTEQLFRGPFMEEYLAAGLPDGAGAMRRILDTYKATWTIFPRNDFRNTHIATAPGWSKAYDDEFVIVYVRGAPQ